MIKKLVKYAKIAIAMALIASLALPSYATVGASDGSAFVTKAEFDAALSDFNARLTTFEAGINSKIDSQVSSYLDRNGIWNGKTVDFVLKTIAGLSKNANGWIKYNTSFVNATGILVDSLKEAFWRWQAPTDWQDKNVTVYVYGLSHTGSMTDSPYKNMSGAFSAWPDDHSAYTWGYALSEFKAQELSEGKILYYLCNRPCGLVIAEMVAPKTGMFSFTSEIARFVDGTPVEKSSQGFHMLSPLYFNSNFPGTTPAYKATYQQVYRFVEKDTGTICWQWSTMYDIGGTLAFSTFWWSSVINDVLSNNFFVSKGRTYQLIYEGTMWGQQCIVPANYYPDYSSKSPKLSASTNYHYQLPCIRLTNTMIY